MLESKVKEQLQSQRVAFLLGAGSSYLDGEGYPLTSDLWNLIRNGVHDERERDAIQDRLDAGATSLEQALDLLDDGGVNDTPYRHSVIAAIGDLFRLADPPLDCHAKFTERLSRRSDRQVRVFSLNYDPLIERGADLANVRLTDGFLGIEHAFFSPEVFDERVGRIRGTYRGRQFDETANPVQLLKLHGSIGWYVCPELGNRRGAYGKQIPSGTKPLMVPPQRRKAADTVLQPYAALWSTFRHSLVHGPNPANRLACIGYGFLDEHVNDVISAALPRNDFTLLVFSKILSDTAWNRWSPHTNSILVTENRCSLNGIIGPGHPDFWRFERLCGEI